MMITDLVRFYETLRDRGEAPEYGYSVENVPYGIELNYDGTVTNVFQYGETIKGRLVNKIRVPAHVTRSNEVKSNFLCDYPPYLFGISQKDEKQDRVKAKYDNAAETHCKILEGLNCNGAIAVRAFFKKNDHPEVKDIVTDRLGDDAWKSFMSSNIVLCYAGEPLTNNDEIRSAWESYYNDDTEDDDTEEGISLVSGDKMIPVKTNPKIKGVLNTKASGASIISFNSPAYCSYGLKQNHNAPMSKYESFAYTTALNTMIKDDKYHRTLNKGTITLIAWADTTEPKYSQVAFTAAGLKDWNADPISQDDVIGIVNEITLGHTIDYDKVRLEPEEHFHIMGLVPNSARIYVPFYHVDTFGGILETIKKHYMDTSIERPGYDTREILTEFDLLKETTISGQKGVSVKPNLEEDLMKAILTGGPYPPALIGGVESRIRAENNVTRGKAAIIKAYYTRRTNHQCPKEVLTVELNKDADNVPYLLGRLFAVYESVQGRAKRELNGQLRGAYFTAAGRTPSIVFPQIVNKCSKYLDSLQPGVKIWYEKKIGELMDRLGSAYPDRLSIPEQGAFQLGYYHERQDLFKPHATNEDETTNQEETTNE